MVLMDGFRINSPTGTPNIIGAQFSLSDAERVEVIIGPASALYGADAFSGVVNIITESGADINGVKTRVASGNFGTKEATVTAGFKIDSLEASASIKRYDSDEAYYPKYYPEEFAWYTDRYLVDGSMVTSPFDPTIVTAPIQPYNVSTNAEYFHGKLRIGRFETGLSVLEEGHSSSLGSKPQFGLYVDNAHIRTRNISLYFRHEFMPTHEKYTLTSSIWHGTFEALPESAFVDLFTQYSPGYKYAKEDTTRLDYRFAAHLTERSLLTLGLMYERLDGLPWTSDLPFPFDPNESPQDQEIYYIGTNVTDANGNDKRIFQDFHYLSYENSSFYLQWQRRFLEEKLEITLGSRWDDSKKYGATTNPRLSFVYSFNDRLTMKLIYGEAFLAPSLFNGYSHYGSFTPNFNNDGSVDFSASFWHLPNPDLEPEELKTYEIALNFFQTNNTNWSLNIFDTSVKNGISLGRSSDETFKGINVDFIEIAQNNSTANTEGATLGLETKLNYQTLELKPQIFYTYTDGELNGLTLPYTAKESIKAGIDISWQKFLLSSTVEYRSRSYSELFQRSKDETFSSPPFTIANLYVEWRPAFTIWQGNASVFLDVDNLFDRRYYNVPTESEEFLPALPQTPRRALLGLKLAW
jgi:iron complex outermembrane receptor protein